MADGNALSAWGPTRRLPLVLQTEAAECALACLAMIAGYHGHQLDLPGLRRRYGSSLKGTSLSRLIEIAQALGFEARPLRAELAYLAQAQLPCILHWDLGHFVVLRRVGRRGVEIHDPAHGRCRLPLAEASRHFTGIVLELAPGADFAPRRERQSVSLRALSGRMSGVAPALLQLLGLALAIEALALAMPFQLQWVIDQVLPAADTDLLWVIALGFLLATAVQAGLAIARAWLLSWLGATLQAQWTINLFGHLLRLPLDFFTRRHMGDLVSRFNSLQLIQATLTGSFAAAVLDGATGLLALGMLCLYSVPLSAGVLAVGALYALLRWAGYRALWRANEEQLVHAARQQSELMESLRGIQAIKLANRQGERRARIANSTLAWASRSMHSQRLTLAFAATSQGLFGAQRVALVALGGWLALRGQFSAGMLMACIAYTDQFAVKTGALIDRLVDFRLLRLHAERIADIALAAPEADAQGCYSGNEPEPSLELRGLGFRYGDDEPWILRGLDLSIRAGESLAIVGPSGCGKSTLAKLILGLLAPSEGSIALGGVDIRRYGLDNYRRLLGTVMQDDSLFAGSIADNIAFFDHGAGLEQIVAAARQANIHDEIMAMPMAYESLVGDMGSALSGGQRQRVILARALYRRPRILVLDEATSHLDVASERAINRHIAAMQITRIVIAHRAETIAAATRVFTLGAAA